jgi:hypothetical protein
VGIERERLNVERGKSEWTLETVGKKQELEEQF